MENQNDYHKSQLKQGYFLIIAFVVLYLVPLLWCVRSVGNQAIGLCCLRLLLASGIYGYECLQERKQWFL